MIDEDIDGREIEKCLLMGFIMIKKIEQALTQFVAEKLQLVERIVDRQRETKSHLIEILGPSGTGKSYLFKQLCQSLDETGVNYNVILPRVFTFNQLEELVKLLFQLDDAEYQKIIENSKDYNTGRKYDFFYYLTETLNERESFKPITLLIDDCNKMDSYTLDFLQYLVQYAPESGLHIIVFDKQKVFTFSEVEQLDYLKTEDISKILSMLYPDSNKDFTSESDILKSITEGNLFILEHIFSEMLSNTKLKTIDLTPFIERQFNDQDIYRTKFQALNKIQRDLMEWIYLLDGRATIDILSSFVKSKKVEQELKYLEEQNYILRYKTLYGLKKISSFQQEWSGKSLETRKEMVTNLLHYLVKKKESNLNLGKYYLALDDLSNDLFFEIVNYLNLINDHQNLIQLHQFRLSKQTEPTERLYSYMQIGKTYKNMNEKEHAAEQFRQCLQICTENSIPAEETIFQLADSLFAINSTNFALEIIKKYTPQTISSYWRAKILLLKAEILMEIESYDESFACLDDAAESISHVDDKEKRYKLQADTRKIKGKIYYYNNEWDQAAVAFKDAESLYKMENDFAGLAAIYNNLGALYMFQGEWKDSEQMLQHSLELEKKRYNLNGISVCYNNLGGLMDDKGDREHSIYYLEEALKLQRLLNEPYNITNIHNNIGVTYMDANDFERAEDAFKQSLDIAITYGFYKNIIATLNNFGALYFKKGDWNMAIEYYDRAIEKSKENDFIEGLLRSYNNLGELYEKRGELNLAYDLYFKGRELLPQVSDDYIKAELYGNLGSVLTKLHKFGEAYSNLMESFDFFKALNAKDKIIEGCQKQAFYFILTRNYESADYYLNTAVKIAKELNNSFELGRIYYLRALLEHKNIELARKQLEEAITIFLETKNYYELAYANYEYANILYESKEWEQALQILKNNRKTIQQFGAIKLLEQNDILMQKISKEYASDLKESKFQENMLNKFYEITQNLNSISDLDILIESSLNNLSDIAEADGGILCLYNSITVPESWEYKIYNNFSHDDKHYETMMDMIQDTFRTGESQNIKQPHFAPQFNHIITFPLSIRNKPQGVVLLFSKHGSHYFPERVVNLINALSNQIIVIIENIRSTNLEKSHAILREQLTSANSFSNIIGKSPKMLAIFQMIEKIKDTPTTILLEGPSGTGKELIARALHYSSNRRNKAFVAQYCGALPESLLESELFGHVKGSFTGAAYDKKGLFEIADGGTFFLDEIADISLSTQAKLLRFLQEGEIKRVGSTKTEKVDVRVICATNITLMDKVKKGDFRLDLYYRLNVIRLEVPSLKERREDIPLLAIHFLDKFNKRMNKNVSGITDETMKCLMNYEWPGNVRQLENEIERATTLADNNSFIKPSDLSEEVYKYAEHTQAVNLLMKKISLKDAVENLEKSMIQKSLEESNWNQTQCAKDLGLSRQGLIKKMKRYNLYREEDEQQ